MSWGSGANLLEEVLGLVEEHLPKKSRKAIVEKMAAMFEDLDADIFGYECESPTLQEIRLDRYPECPKCGEPEDCCYCSEESPS